jgi:hypothetical protein
MFTLAFAHLPNAEPLFKVEQTGYDQFLSASYAAANEPAITFAAK